ncbi:MAG: EAL domain-containing protein [Pseudoxanthomonas sp.]
MSPIGGPPTIGESPALLAQASTAPWPALWERTVNLAWLLGLTLACLVLPFVDVATGPVQPPTHTHTSLAHLQWGLVLAVAMLAQSPVYLRVTFTACFVGWAVRMLWGTPDGSEIALSQVGAMLPSYLLMYGWTVACVRMMGWPRPPRRHHFRQRDVPGFVMVALLLYPLGWALSFAATSGLTWMDAGEIYERAIHLCFSRYFGVLLVTLPMVLLVTGLHEPAATPSRLPSIEWAVIGAYVLIFIGLVSLQQQHQDLSTRVLDQRFMVAAVMVWMSLRLSWRWCVPLIALASALLVACIAQSSANDPAFLHQRLFQYAVELLIIQQICVLMLLISSNRRRVLRRAAEAAHLDGLTGVPNITALRRDLTKRADAPNEIGFLSIEHVENMMAAFGLPAQEALTAALHAHLKQFVDAYTMGMGRFALVPRERRPVSWNEVLQTLEEFEFRYADTRVRMEPHLGVAHLAGNCDKAVDEALHAAFRAKRAARQRAETLPVFADTLENSDAVRLAFETHSLALSLLRKNAVELHVQPIRRIGQAQADMGEVLCRLRGPDGLLMPADYMDELEASRGVVELDRAVVENVLAWMQAHPDNGGYQRLAINLTGRSMVSEHFRNWLLHRLDMFPGAPQRLCFEITERAIEGGIVRATPLLQALHQRGCKIALDDFGTGMQSFDRLQQLPIDLVKIDGAFVRNIVSNVRDRELVRAMVTIANAYQAETVAEYVENEEILRLLRSLGVNWAQGYHISRPQPLPVSTGA